MNNSNLSVDKIYEFTAIIEKRNHQQKHIYGSTRILLRDVRLEGKLFRDHAWIVEERRIKDFKDLSIIAFTAKIRDYLDPDDLNTPKKGIRSLRNIRVIKMLKKFKVKGNI